MERRLGRWNDLPWSPQVAEPGLEPLLLSAVPLCLYLLCQRELFMRHAAKPPPTSWCIKQQLFHSTRGFCSSGIQKGHYRGGLSLFYEVWNSSGKTWSLEVTAMTGVAGIWGLPHQSDCRPGPQLDLSAGARTWFLHMDFSKCAGSTSECLGEK